MPTVSLTPPVVNITGVRAGDRNLIAAAATTEGVPVDLTGQVLSAQARKKAIDPVVALTAVVEVTDETGGTFTIRWPGEEVRTMLAGAASWKGVWDLQMAPGVDEDAITLCAGSFEAETDVTHA
jgi:hypothetical protein